MGGGELKEKERVGESVEGRQKLDGQMGRGEKSSSMWNMRVHISHTLNRHQEVVFSERHHQHVCPHALSTTMPY